MRDVQDAVEYGAAPAYSAPALLDLVLSAQIPVSHEASSRAAALSVTVPEAIVDGVVVAQGWGAWTVPVAPGPHSVVLRSHVFGNVRSVQHVQCVVDPGSRAQVNYRLLVDGRSRAWVGDGSTVGGGATPPVSRALITLLVATMAVAAAIVLLAIIAAVL